jgi:F0F1-type ATP synthase assembly protein I
MGLKDLGKNSPTGQKLAAFGTFGEVATVGLSFLFALVIGTAGGWWVDEHFQTKPWGFLIGFGLGLAAGIRNFYVVLKKYWHGGPGR